MTTGMVQAAETAAMPANGTTKTSGKRSAGTTPPPEKEDVTNGGAPTTSNKDNGNPAEQAPATAGEAPATDGTAAAAPDSEADARAKEEAEQQKKKEDEIVTKGAEIAGIRALLARAFSKPAEEPVRPASTWTYLLKEAAWMATDFSQERLWRRTTALALAYEIAKLGGNFNLKQPPKEFRQYSDEIRDLRAAAAKTAGKSSKVEAPAPAAATSGRRSAREAKAKGDAAGGGMSSSMAAFLQLDPASDPGLRVLEEGMAQVDPGTPPLEDLSQALVFPCDEEFAVALEEHLMQSEVNRLIAEEITVRSYRLEYEASLVSHQLAVAEEIKAEKEAGDLGLGPVSMFGMEGMEGDVGFAAGAGGKKGNKRRKAGGARGGGGFLGLDDFGDEEDGGYGNKRSASKAAMVEDVYLRKRRPQRTPAYRDADADYDVSIDTGARYGTRRATGALARNQARMAADRNRRPGGGSRADAYQHQQANRARAQAQGMAGMVFWSKGEEQLLLAVVHEFGLNWTLVSEVLSLSLGMQGIYRPPAQCRQRFRQLTMQEGQEYSEERAYAALSLQLAKQQARELLVGSLPVRDDALVRLLEALVQVGASAKSRKSMEDKRNEHVRTKRQDTHASYMTVLNGIMQQTGGRELNPLELSAHVNNTYLVQARQQAMMQQQAQQQAAAQVSGNGGQPGAPPMPGQQGMPGAGGGVPGAPMQGQPVAGAAPGQPAVGAPGGHLQQQPAHGTPAGPPPLGGALPGNAGQMGQLPPGAGVAPGQAAQMPPGAAGVAGKPAPTPQITLHQLNNILATKKLPNGQVLTDEMRVAIEKKRTAYLSQLQQQQNAQQQQAVAVAQRQQQAAAAAAGGGAPGLIQGQAQGQANKVPGGPGVPPSAASIAAMHASQQAAAMQAAARPGMPPGMFGVAGAGGGMVMAPGGAPGQPVGMPPGMQGMAMPQGGVLPPGVAPGAPGMGMPPGMVMAPGVGAQHQLLAQQMMQQQHAQQQAAAAAAAAAAQQGKPAP